MWTLWVVRCRAWFSVVVPGLGRRGHGGGGSGGGSGLGGCCTFSFDSGLVVLVALAAFRVACCLSSLLLVAKMKLVWRLWWTVFARSGRYGGVDTLLDMFEVVACLS